MEELTGDNFLSPRTKECAAEKEAYARCYGCTGENYKCARNQTKQVST